MATAPNDCGCCEGLAALVPEPLENRPGLNQVRYRAGTHADFLASALASLSDPRFPALRRLTSRETDDFTIALLDGWATLADVFTFYQERIANELWLGTATERDSIVRLAQLIGYRLKPGVAAETPLSFLLDETSGAPTAVTVAIGTKVQSVPGANEKPQTFETIEALNARVEWNTLRPALTTPPTIVAGLFEIYLKGTATNLNPGDALLIVGDERLLHPAVLPDKERWDMRILLSVTPDYLNDRTHVTWEKGLGRNGILPASTNVKIYALRQRAAFFGHNAPDPSLLTSSLASGTKLIAKKAVSIGEAIAEVGAQSVVFESKQEVVFHPVHFDLDNSYPKILTGSWVTLANSDGYVELYRCNEVSFPSRAAFGISGKVTRITPDTTENLQLFPVRETLMHAQSEPVEPTSGPLLEPTSGSIAAGLNRDPELLAPIAGQSILLDRLVPMLAPGRKIIVTGKSLRVRVLVTSLKLSATDGRTVNLSRNDSLALAALPTFSGSLVKWTLRTDEGFTGTITRGPNDFQLTPAQKDDPAVSEPATIQKCAGEPTVLTLEASLSQLYDRATVTIAANVADSTHGETVSEVLGSGDGAQANQSFKLRQTPLTYVRSTAPGGAESTLQVRVNDLLWHDAPTLFERTARERIFTTEMADDGATTVRFGDGRRGARIASGAQNVKATYRRGIGLEGLVRAGQLSTLLTRPPGLKSAINSLAAEGADEPETLANAQQNAPLTVLTLDRVVSLADYENFSRSYAGIGKALATWTWDGRTRGVFITVAGPRGAAVAGALASDLTSAIHLAGDPFVPVRVVSYDETHFALSGQIVVEPDYQADKVVTAAIAALRAQFSFEQRGFGQSVVLSEAIALIQSVPGVIAVNLKTLRIVGAAGKLNTRLEAKLPNGGDPNSLGAAELLTLDPGPVDLEVLP